MDHSKSVSSKPDKQEGTEDAATAKAIRGNHSRPLNDPDSKKASPSAKYKGEEGASRVETSEDASSAKGKSHDTEARRSSYSVGKSDDERIEGAKGPEDVSKDRKKDAKSAENDRSFIIPEEMLEPASPVDTSANKQQVKQRQVFHENPNIHYMNGESLSRPMALPPSAKVGIIIIIAIAAVLAAVVFYMYFDVTTNEPARERARMEEQLGRDVKLDLPEMLSLLELDDAGIDAQLKATGNTFFERSPVGTAKEYEIVKLPSDVSLEEAAVMYATGLSKLTPSQAATLLNGSWDLLIDRSNGLNMVLHYADFTSGDEASAIANAITAEDLERGTETDSGDNDGYGNHYTTGTIMINGNLYDWSVSAVSLKSVYSVSGLPDDATYVGIRIKGTAE